MEDEEIKPDLDVLRFSLNAILGRTTLTLSEVVRLSKGSVIDLGKAITDPVEIHLNGQFVGTAHVALCGGNYGIRTAEGTDGQQVETL